MCGSCRLLMMTIVYGITLHILFLVMKNVSNSHVNVLRKIIQLFMYQLRDFNVYTNKLKSYDRFLFVQLNFTKFMHFMSLVTAIFDARKTGLIVARLKQYLLLYARQCLFARKCSLCPSKYCRGTGQGLDLATANFFALVQHFNFRISILHFLSII